MNGILMTPDNHNAIREGRKTQTRRVIKPQPIESVHELKEHSQLKGYYIPYATDKRMVNNNQGNHKNDCGYVPKYQLSEVLYIKEAHRYLQNDGEPYDFGVQYRLDSQVKWWRDNANLMDYPIDEKWRSPMFLKEIFARTFIQITDVRAERTKDITPEGCLKEGIERHTDSGNNIFWYEIAGDYHGNTQSVTPQGAYFKLYDSINGNDAHKKNWDWVYSFERLNNGISKS